ncbi:acyltransferase family protein [Flavobacterium panacagri]|uniref:acyltransferase family protein n=1 Tax=Flavobacterium panacagri TaxID=3034146 RepID=UPI0025A5B069|nr:acyltransferase [Flavobacterium panacagri]
MIKNNNFDFLRFLFALLVVLSHAYPLSGSHETKQWIFQVSNGQLVMAQIGLNGFFIISGFFIFQSLERSQSLKEYFRKRFLRLFPALFFVLLFSVVLAPFVYNGSIPFLLNREVYTYIPYNLILYKFQSGIKGIFDTNPYHAINGSLWTIRYEFTLYIVLAFLFFIKNKKTKVVILCISYILFLVLYNFYLVRFAGSSVLGFQGIHVLNLGTFFIAGSLLAVLNFEKIKNKKIILVIALLFIFIALRFSYYDSVKHILLPVIVLLIGFVPITFLRDFGKAGDSSYGIYIYSFPVQQVLMYFFKMDTCMLMITSVVISIALGFLSWHFIEKKALHYKTISFNKIN